MSGLKNIRFKKIKKSNFSKNKISIVIEKIVRINFTTLKLM